jgi:DNA-binding CsgD family transcriptional regulator
MGVMGAAWPLVGREQELTAIRVAMDDASVSGVVLAGAAGVGKTRLAREAIALARAQGLATRWAVATQAASAIPFGALAPLLPDHGGHAPDQAQLLHQATRTLREQAGPRRLVLGVDDAHLLDGVSAALVHQLVAASAAFVVVTIRSGEPVADAILSLWKDGLAERLELQALSRGEVEELVVATLGGQVDGLTLHRLWTATQGNVLLLRELVLAGLDLGELEQRDRIWRWSGPLGVTPRLAELIEARLGRLKGSERAALELLALGEPLGLPVLEQLTAPGATETLERHGLVAVEPRGRRFEIRLAHPLYGEVLRGHTPTLHARAVYRQLTEVFGMRRREDLLRVAIWHLDAGGPARPGLLTAAASRAGSAFDDRLAERLGRAAVVAGGGFDASITLAGALHRQRRFQEAEEVLERLTGLASTDRQRTDLAVDRASNLWLLHRYGDGIELLQRVELEVSERVQRDRLVVARAEYLILSGRGEKALDELWAVLGHDPTDPVEYARAVYVAAWALVNAGRTNEAAAVIGRLETMEGGWAKEAPWLRLEINEMLMASYLLLGRFDQAEAIAEAAYRRSIADHWPWGVKTAAAGLGWIALERGQMRTAVRWGKESLAQIPAPGDAALHLFYLVLPLAVAGQADAAEAAFREAGVEPMEASGLWLLEVEQARWWIAAARGDLSGAVERALRSADRAESMGINDSLAVALHNVVRLGGAAKVAGRLRDLAGRVDGPLVPLYAAHAEALVAKDGAALDEVAASFEAIGAILLAAEAAAEAAVAHRAVGREHAARRSAVRSKLLADQCEGARTPALRLLEQPPELTRREHEIAGLAAMGLSNRAIAERLVVSVRTVDNHLQHVFDKLGIRSRGELRRFIDANDQTEHRG